MTIRVSSHAIARAIERVPGVRSEEEARTMLTSRTIKLAADFSAKFVRLGTGQRVLIEDGCVVTVLPAENYRSHIRRVGKGRYG